MTTMDMRTPLTHSELRTRNPEDIAAKLQTSFGQVENFQVEGSLADFSVTRAGFSFGDVRMCRTEGSGFAFETRAPEQLFSCMTVAGGCTVSHGNTTIRTEPRKTAFAVQPGGPALLRHEAGAVVFGLVATLEALRQQAGIMFGEKHRALVHGDVYETIDLTQGAGAALGRNLVSVFSETTALLSGGLNPVATTGLGEFLASLLLVSSFPAVRDLLSLRTAPAGKSAFDRAVEHLNANAAQPVSMSKLAADLGVSLRSLQLEFQRRLGRSPLEYLFECRLKLSRELLLSGHAGLSVTSVAAQSGFTNLGAFAARYRETFGELPSETLARAARR